MQKIQAVHAASMHVNDDAPGLRELGAAQKLVARRVHDDIEARLQSKRDRIAHVIVVNHPDRSGQSALTVLEDGVNQRDVRGHKDSVMSVAVLSER